MQINYQRLAELARDNPHALQSLGLLTPSSTCILDRVNTGQAMLWTNGSGYSLNVDLWTTPAFDFNVKEWCEVFNLTSGGSDTQNGVTADLVMLFGDPSVTLRAQGTSLTLPAFSTTYHGGRAMPRNGIGNSRFSKNARRLGWTTGAIQ